jgi:thiol:disulfide interchange protein
MDFLINLIFAFIGGVILNCMPCVFPVLSLKAVAIINDTSDSLKLRLNGITYTFGVLTSMLILALVLLMLRTTGYSVGWGFHMQSPVFVLVLLYIMFIISLCFCGLYDIPLLFSHSGKTNSSFFVGMLATLIATPCTVPFMAPAIGFALTQSSIFSISIFLFLGFGISFPYLIISFFPNTLKFLPKPGKWMETLKHSLSFPMLLSSIWLFWVLIKESSVEMILPVFTGLLILTFSIWIWNFAGNARKSTKYVLFILLLFLNLMPFVLSDTAQKVILQQDLQANKKIAFSEEKLSKLVNGGQSVLVTITADWCLTCKFNEVTLNSNAVQQLLKSHNVVYMVGDWTNQDKEITDYIMKFKRGGIPLYVLYAHNNKEGKVLPQILSKELLESEL